MSDDFRLQLHELWCDLLQLDERVDALSKRLARMVKEDPVARRLSTLRGVNALAARKHANVAAVALANKTARIAWAITTKNAEYDPALSALSVTQ